jgi:hypothetical protein
VINCSIYKRSAGGRVGYVCGDGESLFASQLRGQAFEVVLAPGGEDDVALPFCQKASRSFADTG